MNSMNKQSNLLNFSIIVSIFCLGLGYLIDGYWLIVPLLILLTVGWIFSTKRTAFWLTAVMLLSSVILAAAGVVINLSLALMILACTASLVSWELISFKHRIPAVSPSRKNSLMEKKHRQFLALAAVIGLGLALVSASINLRIPFGVVVLLVLIALGGFVYGLQFGTKNKI